MTPPRLLDGYSLEITARDIVSVGESQAFIPPGTPISVTFLPGEDMDARVAAAARVKQLGFIPVPHISARRLTSRDDLYRFVDQLQEKVGIDRVFVIAGDPSTPHGPYEDALAVIRSGALARARIRRVGISGYPEGHPDISDAKLTRAMRDKVTALADLGLEAEVMTQFGFDAAPVVGWLQRVRESGIQAPIRIGVAGPTSVKTLLRFAARCGVGASGRVMAKYGVSITKLLTIAGPDPLIEALDAQIDPAVHGLVGLHFYPFGALTRTATWIHEYGSGAMSRVG